MIIFRPQEKLQIEQELLGFFIAHHPLEFYSKQVNHKTITQAKDLLKFKSKKVKMIGWLVSSKRIRTRDKTGRRGTGDTRGTLYEIYDHGRSDRHL